VCQHNLHHAITSYCFMTSHHTPYCINKSSEKTRIPPSASAKTHERVLKMHGPCLRLLPCEVCASDNTIPMQRLHQESKHHTLALAKKGHFFLKREKKGRCFFAAGTKTVCTKLPRFIKEIYYINIHTNCLQVFLTKPGITFKDIKLAKIQSFSLL
jgi:hypothetical protein